MTPPQRPPLRVIDERGPRIQARMLPRLGGPPLEFLEAVPDGDAAGPPLLFVHGAFGGAWVWHEIFLPHFAARGRHVAALSLRAHGRSGGRDRLRAWRLADYAADVCRACEELPEAPVVVGHSLGGLVDQTLIGRLPMRGLVLLGSLPPEGLLFVGPRLAATEPRIWTEAYLGSATRRREPVSDAMHQVLFSEGLPRERVARYTAWMTPEPPWVLIDAHMPGPVLPAFWFQVPTLVVGGALDRLVWTPSIVRTALYHGAALHVAEGMGHFLQLDIGAPEIAQTILHWTDRNAGEDRA